MSTPDPITKTATDKPDTETPTQVATREMLSSLKLLWIFSFFLASVGVIGGGLFIGGHRGLVLVMAEYDFVAERGEYHHRQVKKLLVSKNYRDLARARFDSDQLEGTKDNLRCPVTVWAAPFPGDPYEELTFIYQYQRSSWHRARIDLLSVDDESASAMTAGDEAPTPSS